MWVWSVRHLASSFGEGKMINNIEAERNRIREILACPGAGMNPDADILAYDSNVSASVAIGVLVNSVETASGGTLPSNPTARALILACRRLRAQGR
jgi:hypothetical protein